MAIISQSEYLKLKIRERGFTLAKVAKMLNLSAPAFNLKVNGKRHFKNYEIKKLLEVLDLKYEELFQVERLEIEVDHSIEIVINGVRYKLDETTPEEVINEINRKIREVS